jgi:bifunctional oligoribonuclease and PAP phosphatase NrnA
MNSPQTTTDLEQAAEAIRCHDRFLLVTHENPDGDALGSILAMKLALEALGKDARMYLFGETPLPAEYKFMDLGALERTLPEDASERVLFALDCANESRLGRDPGLLENATLVLDIDHHHDNTRYGKVNVIVPGASSTAEIVRDLLRELGVGLTPAIAEALYVALVTDTGRFQYSNTTPKALRLAAELVETGVPLHRIFQAVYEAVPFAKLKLLARALESARVYEDGRVVIAFLRRKDFADAGAEEPYAEGIIDNIRSVDGTEMAALIREPPTPGGPKHRVSLRSRSDELDVSVIARKSGGGGHKQAAGFSSELPLEELIEFIRTQFADAAKAPA